jgi:hypothetical protein
MAEAFIAGKEKKNKAKVATPPDPDYRGCKYCRWNFAFEDQCLKYADSTKCWAWQLNNTTEVEDCYLWPKGCQCCVIETCPSHWDRQNVLH